VYRVMNHDVTYINGSIICSSLMTTSLHYEKEKKKKRKKKGQCTRCAASLGNRDLSRVPYTVAIFLICDRFVS